MLVDSPQTAGGDAARIVAPGRSYLLAQASDQWGGMAPIALSADFHEALNRQTWRLCGLVGLAAGVAVAIVKLA